jgi:hypothetical protein
VSLDKQKNDLLPDIDAHQVRTLIQLLTCLNRFDQLGSNLLQRGSN